jgi:hypothetical protein
MAAFSGFVLQNSEKARRVCSAKTRVMRRLQPYRENTRYPGARRSIAERLRACRIFGKRSVSCITAACG